MAGDLWQSAREQGKQLAQVQADLAIVRRDLDRLEALIREHTHADPDAGRFVE